MKFFDLTGQKFEKLTVISRAPNNQRGGSLWNCSCSCGKGRVVEGARLRDGYIKHCGCDNKTPTPLIDLIGQKFGKLTVVSRDSKKRSTRYNCLCDCGNNILVFSQSLRKGITESCPLCRISLRLKDLTGKVFGKLTVLRHIKQWELQGFGRKSSSTLWECLCQCGNKVIVQKNQLKSESNCGCSRKESFNSNANFSDITGRRFGKITVVSRVENSAQWNCHCDCGKDIKYYYSHLVDDKYTSCGCAFIKQYADRTLSSKHALYNNYYRNSKARNLSFDLSFEEFLEFTKKDCFYCGIKPAQYFKASCSLEGFTYNGLDRLDNSKGYNFTNIVSCCKICNRAKWINNKDEFITGLKRSYEYLWNKTGLKCWNSVPKRENPASRFLYKQYARICAKKRGYSFLLNFEEFNSLIQQNCAYCGIFPQNHIKLLNNKTFFYNGLDRIDNHLGYENSNVVACCKSCNFSKGSRTKEDFISWIGKCYNYMNLKDENTFKALLEPIENVLKAFPANNVF